MQKGRQGEHVGKPRKQWQGEGQGLGSYKNLKRRGQEEESREGKQHHYDENEPANSKRSVVTLQDG